MESITVSKEELLGVLRANRERHNAIFLEAQDGYRKLAIEELDNMLADARAGKHIRRAVSLIEPTNQVKDYDRVIRMMEMSIDHEIKLAEHEFQMYVLDEWTWKRQFSLSNISYSKTLQDAGE